ncbi:sensor histidine kinase [Lipingzhangella rawalii]|uniref:sensor histidine kinase n=1 Tax=Lipingzhangella rawalii TaxID=2055835 RepID=UPI0038993C10
MDTERDSDGAEEAAAPDHGESDSRTGPSTGYSNGGPRWRRQGASQDRSGAARPRGSSYLPDKLSLRARLTLIYGMLFFAAGSLLVLVNYVVVAGILNQFDLLLVVQGDQLVPDQQVADQLKAQLIESVLGDLTRYSIIGLVVVGLLAVILGYVVAGRALSPLHRITRTARRLSERSLHERIALGGPDDEIKELADTFDGMLARLDHAFDAQRRFVANASHELRTPLAINRTLLEVALADPDASADLKAIARTLMETNTRHERLIEGLLFLAKSDRELSARSPVDLNEVATTVLGQLSEEVSEAGLQLRTDLHPAPMVGDPVLLERLVANLVENAIRYNTTDGEVIVRVGPHDGAAAVQVENPGPVIPAYEVSDLFDPFRRGSGDRVSSRNSAGLGLSIVRSVVRAHGGELRAWPRPGGGLVVTARFPESATTTDPERRTDPDGIVSVPTTQASN